jgi:hypothetical protein
MRAVSSFVFGLHVEELVNVEEIRERIGPVENLAMSPESRQDRPEYVRIQRRKVYRLEGRLCRSCVNPSPEKKGDTLNTSA